MKNYTISREYFCATSHLAFSYSREYNNKQKGGEAVKRKKKKPTKSRVDVRTIVITAIVDFLVGLALLIIDKLT